MAARLARSRVKCRSGAITVAIFTLIVSLVGGLYTSGVSTRHVSGVQTLSKAHSVPAVSMTNIRHQNILQLMRILIAVEIHTFLHCAHH